MNLAIAGHITTLLVDYFDTVVERTCHPEVVKRKWAAVVSDAWGGQHGGEAIYAHRLKIEAELCRFSLLHGRDAEFCYDEMVSALYHQLCQETYCAQLPSADDFVVLCRDIEIAIELAVQRPLTATVAMLRAEKKKGRKIYLVSDFYLDKKAVAKFIQHHGIADIFSEIYLSSENKRTKKEGGIYDDLIARLNLDVKKTLMLGDNVHSDISVAQSKGLLAWHLPADMHRYKESLQADNDRSAINRQLRANFKNDRYNFNWAGGAIYLFIRRLYWRLFAQQAKNVYFFSREGEFLQQVFNKYQSTLPPKFPRVDSHYVYVSRRATYLPSLLEGGQETFSKYLDQYSACSLTTFLKSINLDSYIEVFQKLLPQTDFNERHLNIANLPEFHFLITSPEFSSLYEKERTRQKANCNRYFDENFKEKAGEIIHVVDVGWKGSIQDNLAAITQRPMRGYYIGLLEGAEFSRHNLKEGLLFDRQWKGHHQGAIFNEFRAGFEVLISASHGSLEKYGDNGIQLDQNDAEQAIYKKYIFPFQQRTLQLFDSFAALEESYSLCDADIASVINKVYFSGVMLPCRFEIELFSAVSHYENFGGFHFSRFGLQSRSRLSYLKNILCRPASVLGDAWWKPLDFYAHGVSFLKYPYMLLKKIKYRRLWNE